MMLSLFIAEDEKKKKKVVIEAEQYSASLLG